MDNKQKVISQWIDNYYEDGILSTKKLIVLYIFLIPCFWIASFFINCFFSAGSFYAQCILEHIRTPLSLFSILTAVLGPVIILGLMFLTYFINKKINMDKRWVLFLVIWSVVLITLFLVGQQKLEGKSLIIFLVSYIVFAFIIYFSLKNK